MRRALGLLIPLFLISCGRGGLDASRFLAERDSIMNLNQIQRQKLDDVNAVMSIISESLDSIVRQEQLIYFPQEGKPLSKRHVLDNLRIFEELLERQRKQIAVLRDSLQQKGPDAQKMAGIISFLNAQLTEKDNDIRKLKRELSSRNKNISELKMHIDTLKESISTLEQKNEMQVQALSAQDMAINEGYVKIASKKELQEEGIISAGGLFAKKQLNVSNFNKEYFRKIDIRRFNEVAIRSKRPKILTAMPESSYRMEKMGNETILYITDPTLFWSVSNYLVIQTN